MPDWIDSFFGGEKDFYGTVYTELGVFYKKHNQPHLYRALLFLPYSRTSFCHTDILLIVVNFASQIDSYCSPLAPFSLNRIIPRIKSVIDVSAETTQ